MLSKCRDAAFLATKPANKNRRAQHELDELTNFYRQGESAMDHLRKLCFSWGVSDFFGWGIYGLNLLTYGQMSPDFQVIPLEDPEFMYPIDPLADRLISHSLRQREGVSELSGDDILLLPLGNTNRIKAVDSARRIGVIFNEVNPLPEDEISTLKQLEFIVCGSTWNARALDNQGVNTRTVIQGVDLDLFRWAPKKYLRNRFVVFSGGKLEYRKGQDLVLKAFSIFASRHDDAVLLAAWRSPWEQKVAKTVNISGLCEPLVPSEDMGLSIKEWVLRNGVKPDQVLLLDATPNRLMPEVFREADIAIFPSRCEAGTNLVAMEALASGLPCMLSSNTGHLDLIGKKSCIPLEDQTPLNQNRTYGWSDSSVAEMVDLMEDAYQGRIVVDPSAARTSMLPFSWEKSIGSLLSLF